MTSLWCIVDKVLCTQLCWVTLKVSRPQMTTKLSPGTWCPATCSFGACSTQGIVILVAPRFVTFKAKMVASQLLKSQGKSLYFRCQLRRERQSTAGVESRPRPPGANGAERRGWLKCHRSRGEGRAPPTACASPYSFREKWTPGWSDFLLGNLVGCLHPSQVCSTGRLSRQKNWAWGKVHLWGLC